MAKAKGSPKTGGRKPGSLNKRTADLVERLNEHDQDPFDILFAFARGDWKALGYESSVYHKENSDGSTTMGYVIAPELRQKAAKDACEYLYPKRKALEVSGKDGEDIGIKIIIEDYGKK